MSARPVSVPGLVAVFLLLTAALVLTGGASARTTAFPTLYVNYTMKCTFTITDDSGKTVSSIPPGAWQVQVLTPVSFSGVDLSGVSDMTACKGSAQFQLTGPGVNAQTSMNDGDGSEDLLSVNFQPNSTYVAQDLNQASVTRTTITTTAAGTGSTSGGTSSGGSSSSGSGSSSSSGSAGATASGPLLGTLHGTVTAAGKVTLSYKGKALTEVAAGLYKISVVDKSKKTGFVVQAGAGKKTTVSSAAHTGTSTVSVNFKAGQWYYLATPGSKKLGFIVTSPLYG